MSAVKVALQQRQKSARKKTSKTMSAEASPDSKCPICLDIFNNISYLDSCLHKFCFRCILEWSKNKAECPLCKQPFNSIYHSIKSEQDYKKYDLRPVDNGSFGTFEGVRFRYRTTLTGVRRLRLGRTSPPPDNGVMFEASTSHPQQPQDRYIRRMIAKLAASRRAASEGRTVNNVREQEMVNFRRELYRRGVMVRSVRDGGRSRDTSAEFYRRNPACLHRLIPFLKRELIVLYGAHGSLVNIVQHIIMSRITRYDMEDRAIQEELRPFLQGRTEHFLHEFLSFARSPFNLEAYDQHAVYDCPALSSNEDSSSNSSVIAISEGEEDSSELPAGTTFTLTHSLWDDETPGPSYSTTANQSKTGRQSVLHCDTDSSSEAETQESEASQQQINAHTQSLTQTQSNIEECLSSDSDDCIIVSFVKPTAERTPELVQLSSNSEESESEDTKVPILPQHIRFNSLSPTASHSSNLTGVGRSKIVEPDCHQQLELTGKQSLPTASRSNRSSLSEREPRDKFVTSQRSRERHRSHDRDHRRRRRRWSRSGERSSRSPINSHSSFSSYSNERRYWYSSGRDYAKCDSANKRKGASQSYSNYCQERSDNRKRSTKWKSSYSRRHNYLDWRSHSRSSSRESHRQDRRHSPSRTCSSSRSPSPRGKSHHDKPGGKRKYKTRHLEEHSNSFAEGDMTLSTKQKKKSKEKHHKKSKESSRKTSRSLSVELVKNEETSEPSKRHHKKKKKHKKKSKRHKSSERAEKHSPTVITIDSECDSDPRDPLIKNSNTKTLTNRTTEDDVEAHHQ